MPKLTMMREDVDALEDAADALMRRSATEQATRLYALVMRLRTEAGWTPPGIGSHSVRAPLPVPPIYVDFHRGD